MLSYCKVSSFQEVITPPTSHTDHSDYQFVFVLFPTIFDSVDERHFLKNWGHSDLRSQKYAEVAENSLRLIKNVSITKTWFFKLLQVARLMVYPETLNRHQNFSLALRRPRPRKSGVPTRQPQSTFSKKNPFLWYEINIKSSISRKFQVDKPRGYRNTRSASPWCLPLVIL